MCKRYEIAVTVEGIQGRKCAPLEDMIHRTMNHVQAWTELGRGIRQRHEVIVLDVENHVQACTEL